MREAKEEPEARRQLSHRVGLAAPSWARKRRAMLEEGGKEEAGEAGEAREGERLPLRRRMQC